jgi:hypothetical protein
MNRSHGYGPRDGGTIAESVLFDFSISERRSARVVVTGYRGIIRAEREVLLEELPTNHK